MNTYTTLPEKQECHTPDSFSSRSLTATEGLTSLTDNRPEFTRDAGLIKAIQRKDEYGPIQRVKIKNVKGNWEEADDTSGTETLNFNLPEFVSILSNIPDDSLFNRIIKEWLEKNLDNNPKYIFDFLSMIMSLDNVVSRCQAPLLTRLKYEADLLLQQEYKGNKQLIQYVTDIEAQLKSSIDMEKYKPLTERLKQIQCWLDSAELAESGQKADYDLIFQEIMSFFKLIETYPNDFALKSFFDKNISPYLLELKLPPDILMRFPPAIFHNFKEHKSLMRLCRLPGALTPDVTEKVTPEKIVKFSPEMPLRIYSRTLYEMQNFQKFPSELLAELPTIDAAEPDKKEAVSKAKKTHKTSLPTQISHSVLERLSPKTLAEIPYRMLITFPLEIQARIPFEKFFSFSNDEVQSFNERAFDNFERNLLESLHGIESLDPDKKTAFDQHKEAFAKAIKEKVMAGKRDKLKTKLKRNDRTMFGQVCRILEVTTPMAALQTYSQRNFENVEKKLTKIPPLVFFRVSLELLPHLTPQELAALPMEVLVLLPPNLVKNIIHELIKQNKKPLDEFLSDSFDILLPPVFHDLFLTMIKMNLYNVSTLPPAGIICQFPTELLNSIPMEMLILYPLKAFTFMPSELVITIIPHMIVNRKDHLKEFLIEMFDIFPHDLIVSTLTKMLSGGYLSEFNKDISNVFIHFLPERLRMEDINIFSTTLYYEIIETAFKQKGEVVVKDAGYRGTYLEDVANEDVLPPKTYLLNLAGAANLVRPQGFTVGFLKTVLTEVAKAAVGGRLKVYRGMKAEFAVKIMDIFNKDGLRVVEDTIMRQNRPTEAEEMDNPKRIALRIDANAMPIGKHLGDLEQASTYAQGQKDKEALLEFTLKSNARKVLFSKGVFAVLWGQERYGYMTSEQSEGECDSYIGSKSEGKTDYSLCLSNPKSELLFQLLIDQVRIVSISGLPNKSGST